MRPSPAPTTCASRRQFLESDYLPPLYAYPNSSISAIKSTDDTCCWQCRSCGEFQRKSNDHKCSECPSGTRPNPDHSVCADIPEEFIDFHDPWAIGAMAVASLGRCRPVFSVELHLRHAQPDYETGPFHSYLGVLLTVFVALIFWTYSDTPVIKASGRELSYLLLLGTLASFCMTFVIVSRPTSFTCGLTRFFLGFCYTLCYAAIVTKTNRIARIFNNTAHSPHKTRYTSPQSQLVITALLTLVEVVINVTWLMYVPPRVIHVYPDRGSRVLICDGLKDHSYFVGLLYPFVLIGLCTAYAIKTRKCPGGFNETRHIAFTNYTTIIIWLAFVPLYLASTSNSIRIVTLAISLSLGTADRDLNPDLPVIGSPVHCESDTLDQAGTDAVGLVQLGCLFFPKLYIVLFKPEKNTKEVVMSQHRSTVYLSTPSNLTPVVVVNGGTHYVQSAGVMNVDATEIAKKSRRNTGSGIWGLHVGWSPSNLWDGVAGPLVGRVGWLDLCIVNRLGIAGHDTSTRSPLGKSWPKPRETEAIPKAQFLTFSSDVGDHKRRMQLLLSRASKRRKGRNKPSLKEVMTTTKTSPDLVQGGHTKDDAFAEDAPKSKLEYANVKWSSITLTDSLRLETIQSPATQGYFYTRPLHEQAIRGLFYAHVVNCSLEIIITVDEFVILPQFYKGADIQRATSNGNARKTAVARVEHIELNVTVYTAGNKRKTATQLLGNSRTTSFPGTTCCKPVYQVP
uniref:G-protein coupled receptors family 3 profile domain-containing protein n=1 Tax=Timema monikensis TaxID=170555 RepID=A0A7R9E4G2_9NEOP|nr:unnamed protein product [Timema monikensis]